MIRLGKTAAVADQAGGYGALAKCVDCRYPMLERQFGKLSAAIPQEKAVGGDGESINSAGAGSGRRRQDCKIAAPLFVWFSAGNTSKRKCQV